MNQPMFEKMPIRLKMLRQRAGDAQALVRQAEFRVREKQDQLRQIRFHLWDSERQMKRYTPSRVTKIVYSPYLDGPPDNQPDERIEIDQSATIDRMDHKIPNLREEETRLVDELAYLNERRDRLAEQANAVGQVFTRAWQHVFPDRWVDYE